MQSISLELAIKELKLRVSERQNNEKRLRIKNMKHRVIKYAVSLA